MAERTRWQLGSWTFDAEGARLIEAENETPLEHRAARTLELLCRERGQLVTREAILAHVWEGRSVSAASVAVVTADLRRALGDDAGAPRFIATVPKRGYRLFEEAPKAVAPLPRVPARTPIPRALVIALAMVALFGSVIFTLRDRFRRTTLRLSWPERRTIRGRRNINRSQQHSRRWSPTGSPRWGCTSWRDKRQLPGPGRSVC